MVPWGPATFPTALSSPHGASAAVEPHRPGQTVPSDCIYSLDWCQTFPVFPIITLTFLAQIYTPCSPVLRAVRQSRSDFKSQHQNRVGSRVHPAWAIPGLSHTLSRAQHHRRGLERPQGRIRGIALPVPLLLPILLASGFPACVE